MKAYAQVRPILILLTFCLSAYSFGPRALAQDVGSDVGGAGIFRPKNPETKKRTPRTSTTPARTTTPTRSTSRNRVNTSERVEDLLDKGNELRDARKFAEAENAYEDVLKINARDARAAYGLGNVYSDQQRWEDAEEAYRNAVLWGPTNVDALVALSVVLVQPRSGAGNAKRFAEAEGFARRAVQREPKNAVAWDRLGVALQARGTFNNETEHAYRRAVELDPEFAVAHVHLGRILKRIGRPAEAAPLYERAVTLAKDAPTLNLIAESLQGEQQWELSAPVLERALALEERNPRSLLLYGRTLVVLKRYAEAERYLKTATEVSPRAFEPFNLLGRTYLALERFSDAEAAYDKALPLASAGDRKQLSGIYGFQGVGDGYLKGKQKANAARAYQRALELDPENKELEKKLSEARSR